MTQHGVGFEKFSIFAGLDHKAKEQWGMCAMKESYLVFGTEYLELLVKDGVFLRLLLAQGSFLLELWTPEGLDAVHAGA